MFLWGKRDAGRWNSPGLPVISSDLGSTIKFPVPGACSESHPSESFPESRPESPPITLVHVTLFQLPAYHSLLSDSGCCVCCVGFIYLSSTTEM